MAVDALPIEEASPAISTTESRARFVVVHARIARKQFIRSASYFGEESVYHRLDLVAALADLVDSRHFPRPVVSNAENFVLTIHKQFVDAPQSTLEEGLHIWTVQIPHIDLLRI
jgi:hypothetical protein